MNLHQQYAKHQDNTLNASNLSNIQKELKPNKAVKGNSVFSNQHKLTILKSDINKDLDPSKQHHVVGGPITKLNAHQITRYNQNSKKNSFIEKDDSTTIKNQITTKGPQLGTKYEPNINGDNQIVNSAIGSSKKNIKTIKNTMKRGGSARPVKDQ